MEKRYGVGAASLRNGGENYYVYNGEGLDVFTLNVVIMECKAYMMYSNRSEAEVVTPYAARCDVLLHAAKAAKAPASVIGMILNLAPDIFTGKV